MRLSSSITRMPVLMESSIARRNAVSAAERVFGLLAARDVVCHGVEPRLQVAPVDADRPAEPAPGVALADPELERPIRSKRPP
jgi:hypothetical protein